MSSNQTTASRSQQPDTLSPPSNFEIMDDFNEKAELESSGDYDQFLNQQRPQSGLGSSASSITAFDPTRSADRDAAYHSDDDDLRKDYSSSTPFLPQGHHDDEESAPEPKKAAPEHVTWMSLPHKGQLLILFLCRMVDFLQVATLQAYIFYQLKHMAQQQTAETDGTGKFLLVSGHAFACII